MIFSILDLGQQYNYQYQPQPQPPYGGFATLPRYGQGPPPGQNPW